MGTINDPKNGGAGPVNRRAFLAAASKYALIVSGVSCADSSPCSRTGISQTNRKPNIIVIFTDDQGFADLQCQGQVDDIKTPNIDRLAAEGVRFTDGYVTAPQCAPSRAALITGRYQQRFGLDDNSKCPMPTDEITVADRLKAAGYVTGMVGKWHLERDKDNSDQKNIGRNSKAGTPSEEALRYYPQNRGFKEFFKGELQQYWASYALDGTNLNPQGEWVKTKRYRLDAQSDAAVAFIERHPDEPFFLYLAYFGPHVPLSATEEYLERFPGEMPERRRYALAMMSAIDDGVGRILDTLDKHGIGEDTLIFFISDNGAPLKLTKEDSPIKVGHGWDGSLNDPWVGEKGMLSEGGIHVPFLMRWKGVLPEGMTYSNPVITLDVAATATTVAGIDIPPELDGVNLLPYLTDTKCGLPHETLYWRFWSQSAVRRGRWKYLQVGENERYLFDLSDRAQENHNVIVANPDIVETLRKDLENWDGANKNPGLLGRRSNEAEQRGYQHYFGQTPEGFSRKKSKMRLQETVDDK